MMVSAAVAMTRTMRLLLAGGLAVAMFAMLGFAGCSLLLDPADIVTLPNDALRADGSVHGKLVRAAVNRRRALLILPGASGYRDDYLEFARRFPDWNALVLDYYRGGADVGEDALSAVTPSRFPQWKRNIVAGSDYLVDAGLARRDGIVLVGFSRGGTLAYSVIGDAGGYLGLISYYAGVEDALKSRTAWPALLARLPPVLLIAGGADDDDVADARALHDALREANRDVELRIAPDMPHGFLDFSGAAHRQASQWSVEASRMFLDRLLRGGSQALR